MISILREFSIKYQKTYISYCSTEKQDEEKYFLGAFKHDLTPVLIISYRESAGKYLKKNWEKYLQTKLYLERWLRDVSA